MDKFYYLPFIFLCFVLEGLFSGGEIALLSSDPHRIRGLAEKGDRKAKYTLRLMEEPEWFLATTLTGTNLSVVAGSSMATTLFVSLFGLPWGEVITAVVMLPLFVLMISVRGLFQSYGEKMALRLSRFIHLSSYVFYPFVLIISRLSKKAAKTLGSEKGFPSPYVTKDGLKYLLDDRGGKSDILSTEREMVKGILDFSNVTVEKIMVPLSNVTALPEDATLNDAVLLVKEKKYSTIPVYRGQTFNIIGIIDYFDLLEAVRLYYPDGLKNVPLQRFLRRDILYVPESKLAKDLLIELQKRGEQMAVVVDEYGGAVGIVTSEDILEEIVGEIDNEYERGDKLYKRLAPGKYLLNARISIERLRQLLPVNIPEGDYETLGGFLLYRLGKIPKRKEFWREGEVVFIIEDADTRAIHEVVVEFPVRYESKGKGLWVL